ncbi:MAG: YraN family protein [Desmonostoc vinosum HA7617-LM4]|jgi:putative endonuclease|nr:YraN family protein [Desmonostoc vinosum HA7617-LM4]
MANPPPSHYPDIGQLGEDLVAQWLQSTGWTILHRRFSCRWGEIDIIAQHNGEAKENSPSSLHSVITTQHSIVAFVEVKTRSSGNWDAWGKDAIAPKKQAKIWRTARIFLAQHPEKSEYSCRFDVAVVHCQRLSTNSPGVIATQETLATSSVAGYKLKLQEYIPAAFDSIIDDGQ